MDSMRQALPGPEKARPYGYICTKEIKKTGLNECPYSTASQQGTWGTLPEISEILMAT